MWNYPKCPAVATARQQAQHGARTERSCGNQDTDHRYRTRCRVSTSISANDRMKGNAQQKLCLPASRRVPRREDSRRRKLWRGSAWDGSVVCARPLAHF